jgi:hypothetical protein
MINVSLVNRGDLRPAHQHDCSECDFQGIVQHDDAVYDVYRCNAQHKPYVVARYSSVDSDLVSFPEEIVTDMSKEFPNSSWRLFNIMVRERKIHVLSQNNARQLAIDRHQENTRV